MTSSLLGGYFTLAGRIMNCSQTCTVPVFILLTVYGCSLSGFGSFFFHIHAPNSTQSKGNPSVDPGVCLSACLSLCLSLSVAPSSWIFCLSNSSQLALSELQTLPLWFTKSTFSSLCCAWKFSPGSKLS